MITKDIKQAIEALNKNDIIAIPTETVYGLAGNAFDETALKKIFKLKNRPFFNPLIVHIKSMDYLPTIATNIPSNALKLAEKFWPGPLTLLLEKLPQVPNLVTADKNTVAIRIPNHPTTLELLKALPYPLAAPSANPFGSISPTSADHVYNYFQEELAIILDGGNCERGIESTIIGFQGNQPILFRHGSIPIEEIEAIVGKVHTNLSNDKNPLAPGMLSKHYAPSTPLYIVKNIQEELAQHRDKKIALLLFKNKIPTSNTIHQEILSTTGDLNEAASNLYSALHKLDTLNLDIILTEAFPDNGLGKSINDRIKRASIK